MRAASPLRRPQAAQSVWLKSTFSLKSTSSSPEICRRGAVAWPPAPDAGRRLSHLQSFPARRQSGGEADLAGGGEVVAGELAGALRQPLVGEEAHQRL